MTILGSALGAVLLLEIPKRALEVIIAVAMIGVAVFTLIRRSDGETERPVSQTMTTTGYGAAFLLADYGGFFGGGYVTILTPTLCLFFGMTLLQSELYRSRTLEAVPVDLLKSGLQPAVARTLWITELSLPLVTDRHTDEYVC